MLNYFLLIIGATMPLPLIAYLCLVTVQMKSHVIQVFITVQMISHIYHDKNGHYCKTVISFIDHVAIKHVFYCIYSNMSPILWICRGNIYHNISVLLGYTNFVL